MGANAQTTVPTFTAGNVLTADQMNQSARTGVPVFTSSTTRDAAFGGSGEKTLAEGQYCYLEDTKILQVYNGSAWVTLSPTGANILTQQSTASGTYVDLATAGPSVTINTGTSAIVSISTAMDTNAGGGNYGFISVAVSGATTIAASDDRSARGRSQGVSQTETQSATFIITGLTSGSNTFKMQYRTTAGTTWFYANRYITVTPL